MGVNCMVVFNLIILCDNVINSDGMMGFCFCGIVDDLLVFVKIILLMLVWVSRVRLLFIFVSCVVICVIYVVSFVILLCLVC